MDDCRELTVVSSNTLYLLNLSDRCSRYKFHPLTSATLPCDEEMAGHLIISFPGLVLRCFVK
jgi:hypothetical protein